MAIHSSLLVWEIPERGAAGHGTTQSGTQPCTHAHGNDGEGHAIRQHHAGCGRHGDAPSGSLERNEIQPAPHSPDAELGAPAQGRVCREGSLF